MRMLIYGSKNFSATVAELIRHCGHEIAGLIDDYDTGAGILGDFESMIRTCPPSQYGIAVAVGYSNLAARWTVWERIQRAGYVAPPLVHPRAYIADSARIGQGVMVMAGAIVDVRVAIEDLVVLWPGVCVNHDSQVGQNSFISPNATLCGFTNIGEHCFIGAGSVIVDHGKVPSHSFIKMLSRYKG